LSSQVKQECEDERRIYKLSFKELLGKYAEKVLQKMQNRISK
jgi:hypothetical protein